MGKKYQIKQIRVQNAGILLAVKVLPQSQAGKTKAKSSPLFLLSFYCFFAVSIFLPNTKKKSNYENYSYSSESRASYSSSHTSKTDDSTIFNHLEITNFSCYSGKYYGKMQCSVKNNNSHTVGGWFRVNFYDGNGALIYNQLMSLPDVAPGECAVCSTTIPRDDYPYDYANVDFSQATLSIEN